MATLPPASSDLAPIAGDTLAPVVQGAPAPTLPRAGATVCLVGAEGEVYVRVVHANADRVVVSYYGRPLAITSRSTRWPSLDGAAKAAAVDELLLAAPPPALDVGALVTLPARWDSLPRARKIAIRRAILEARALLAQVVAHLEGP